MKKLLLFLAVLPTMAFAQVTIGTGTAVDSNTGLSTPISIWYATSLSQFIYTAAEIQSSGDITGIRFQLDGTQTLTASNDMIDVWIGHTANAVYNPVVGESGADWIPVADHSHVVTNGSFSQSGNQVTFTFSSPFAYNGTDNLVITVDANEPGDDGSATRFLQTAASPNIVSLMIRTDSADENADPLNMPLNYTGTTTPLSVQAKNTRPIITLLGLQPLSIADHASKNVAVYPNPVESALFFDGNLPLDHAEIYSITGQLIRKAAITNGSTDVRDLASGVYVVKVFSGETESGSVKVVKE